MTSDKIRESFLNFWKSSPRNHQIIPAAPLVPPDDPTTLFTSSGMQQLVPFLKGEAHPMGKRLVDSQPCFRAEDINEIGDNRHTTYFEMLGNWSLGDYFKKEQLAWFFTWLTGDLNLDPRRLYVTVFAGSNGVKKDEEALSVWKKIGLKNDHIFEYGADKNWWSRSGGPDKMPVGEIGGPDSEVFFEFTEIKHDKKFGAECHPNCDCGRFLEIGNSVFMQYQKQEDGSMKPLPKQNVDFGGGLERLTAAVNNEPDIFKADFFAPLISQIEKAAEKKYDDNKKQMRLIADHWRASQAMIAAGVEPSNKQQGYVLRRLIRRSAVAMRSLRGELNPGIFPKVFQAEIVKFNKALVAGLKVIAKTDKSKINESFAFDLLQTQGLPFEVTSELIAEKGIKLNESNFNKLIQKHRDLSRTASAGMFRGGLADHSENVVKLHTTTHLLHAALRKVLGSHVKQEGSNITSERLRFDFAHPQALTEKELAAVEKLINDKIRQDLQVVKTIEDKDKALQSGAMAFFRETYPDKVSVYTIGGFSRELCGGPHVSSTGQIGNVKIIKDEAIGAGKRRIYAVITHGDKKHFQKTKAAKGNG